MKTNFFKIIAILFLVFAYQAFSTSTFAQAPQKMSYQAVIRNSSDQLVISHVVGMKISILKGSSTGTPVYFETQTPTTNANGLVSIGIGGGTGFDTINWASGSYFIQTEIDPSGGTSYTITGASELLSVPYALYSANGSAGNLGSGSATGNTPYWDGSTWVTNSSNIFNNGGNIGIGTSTPLARFDIAGGNNWDVQNGEGDLRIGDTLYRLRMGVALNGGGAGAVGIMQYGKPGGYNVLSLGAQGTYLLCLNGSSQKVGIGTNNPNTTLDIRGTLSVVDGTQGTGKILTSDANGTASWSGGSTHTIGESYGGGIVFYVYDGGHHGLIAATADQSAGIQWYNLTFRYTGTTGDGVGAGAMNTAMIVATQISDNQTGNFAAKACADYSVTVGGVTYGDWYLPSKFELNLLYLQKNLVGGFASLLYWSSTESDNINVWHQNFVNGGQGKTDKSYAGDYVRAIRAF